MENLDDQTHQSSLPPNQQLNPTNQNIISFSSPLPNKEDNPNSKLLVSNSFKELLQLYEANSEQYYKLLTEKEKISYGTLKSEMTTYSTKYKIDTLMNLKHSQLQKKKKITHPYETFPELKIEQLCINPITNFQITDINKCEFICPLKDGLTLYGKKNEKKFTNFDLNVSNENDLNYNKNIKQLFIDNSEAAMLYLAYNIQ